MNGREIDRLITVEVGGHDYGLDISCVREGVTGRSLLTVPMAPSPIAGLLLMRGDVTAAVDLRLCLGLGPAASSDAAAPGTVDAVVLESNSASLALVVDAIGDVVAVPATGLLPPPDTLSPGIARLTRGTCIVQDRAFLVLDETELFASALASPKELVR